MANRVYSPDQQFCDQNGLPYAGGTLSFYASGTSTPLNTYSDQALTIPNINPITLDSAGRAGSVFLQNLAYKVILADVNLNSIWTEDPVYSSDFSTTAQVLTNAGNPNGVVAGTAGSGTIPSSVIWDSVNNILYVATQTGSASTTVWTAINAATAAGYTAPPTGYLTPTSVTPVITSDVTAATALLYTPYVGNTVPIYNGTSFTTTTYTELTLTLNAAHSANTLYDVFVFNNSGSVTLISGPAWSSSTAGSCSRGAATAITKLNGIWVNNISMTARNGATTYTVGANLATYLGTMWIDSTNGQISFHRSYGQSRKWAAWNAYNRVPLYLKSGDSTASWTIGTSLGSINSNAANMCSVMCGLAEETIDSIYTQIASPQIGAGQTGTIAVAIGWNSTTVGSGKKGQQSIFVTTSAANVNSDLIARYTAVPSLGINSVQMLEATPQIGAGHSSFGTEAACLLTTVWRG